MWTTGSAITHTTGGTLTPMAPPKVTAHQITAGLDRMRSDQEAVEHRECGLCGGPDAKHRSIEAQMERCLAGEPITEVAADYGFAVADMIEQWYEGYGRALDGWSQGISNVRWLDEHVTPWITP